MDYERNFTNATPISKREAYWKKWLEDHKLPEELEDDPEFKEDTMARQLYNIIEKAYELKQFSYPEDEFEDTTRLLRVRIDFSQKELKACFGIDTYNLYGEGLYLPIEGIMLTSGTRSAINYDNSVTKGARLKLDGLPVDVISTHKWGCAVPALNGLFVPKKTRIMEYIYSARALQYLDLQIC